MKISGAQHKAAGEFVDLVAENAGSGGRAVHPETAIACCGWVAGTLLFRSFNFQITPSEAGTVVLSNEANEKGPLLMNTLGAYLAHHGIELDPAAIGGEKMDRGSEPKLTIVEALSLLQAGAMSIIHKYGLDLEDGAQSAALATGFIVSQCVSGIGATTAFNRAVFSFIEGTKTVPPVMDGVDSPSRPKKPWYKFW